MADRVSVRRRGESGNHFGAEWETPSICLSECLFRPCVYAHVCTWSTGSSGHCPLNSHLATTGFCSALNSPNLSLLYSAFYLSK